MRAQLALAVSSGHPLDKRDSAPLPLLAAIGRIDIVAGGAQTALTRKEIRAAYRDLADSWWVSAAVRDAVKRANSAASGAVGAAAATAAVSST